MTLKIPRTVTWLLVIIFVLTGMYMAWTRSFENWAGAELQRAAPTARKVLPPPAKRVLRESREHLPVYGPTGSWLVRKSASIVYFAAVGWFALALRRRTPGSLKETLLVTTVAGFGMSAIVEILEAPFGEELGSQLLDLSCGVVGGLAAGLIAWPYIRKS